MGVSFLKSTPAGFHVLLAMHKDCMCSAFEWKNTEVLFSIYFSYVAKRKKHYKNNNGQKREHEKPSGLKVSSLNKVISIAVKNTA